MKQNHRSFRHKSTAIFVIALSFCLAFSMLNIPMAYAADDTQVTEPSENQPEEELAQPSEEPTPQPSEDPAQQSEEQGEAESEEPMQIVEVDGFQCVDGEVIVKFTETTSDAAIQDTLESVDSEVQQELPVDDLLVTEVPEGETVEDFIDTLEEQPNVEYVQPNYVYQLGVTINDSYASSQWHLSTINTYDAWNVTMGSPDVRVAVLDTGIDLDHPDLSGQIYAQTDVVDNDGSADDDDGHGTHVAGIIAATANNGIGVAGIAPGVKLIVVDVFGPDYANTTDIIEGIHYAVSNGADIINMSFGGYENDTAFETAVATAVSGGVVCVAAAGNDNTSTPCYPSDYDSVISVIATTSSDTKASWSNYGSAKDISAPGEYIVSTYIDGGYAYMSGTSMASPVVAGVVALILSANPDLSVNEVKEILYSTAVDLGESGNDATYGWGRVDAYAAVAAAAGVDDTPVTEDDDTPVTTYEVSATANNSYGSISGAGTYNAGTSVTLSATPSNGYRFVRWLKGGAQISADAIYTFTVSESCTFTAEFAAIEIPAVSANATGPASVTVNWGAVTGAAGYQVWRSTYADSGYSKIATTADIQYIDSGLVAGTTYYYKVAAYCTASTATTVGSLSSYASAIPASLTAPSVSAAASGYSSIRVSWNAVAEMAGYQVYRATSANGTYSLIKTTSSLSYTNTSLKTGTTYYYKVRAYRLAGRTKVYGDYSAVVYATPILSSVAVSTATAISPTKVKVSWSSVAGRSRYEVWRSEDDGAYTRIGTTTKTYYYSANLTPFKTYRYYIRVYRTVSRQNIYASEASPIAAVVPVLKDVANVKVAISKVTSIKLTWSSVSGASGYEVLRWDEARGEYVLLGATTRTYYYNSKLIPNQAYNYQVRAYCKVGIARVYSAPCNPVTAMPVFGSVTNPKAVRYNSTKIKLTWSAVSGRSGYEIYRATSIDGNYELIGSTTRTYYYNSRLTTGTPYYYKIRAYVIVNGIRQYSDYSAVVTATP